MSVLYIINYYTVSMMIFDKTSLGLLFLHKFDLYPQVSARPSVKPRPTVINPVADISAGNSSE